MAKNIEVKLEFDTSGAQKSAKEFADEVDVVTGSLEDLEAQQDELLKKLKGVEVGTAEFKELAAELNGIKSQIKDAELAFEGLDMEQRFTAATDALGGVAGGFAAVEGAIAIAGVESAEFEETMLRVQGAMALAMGIKDISTAAAAIRKLNLASKAAAVTQKALNVVMNANPIGLIVTAIGLLVAGFIAFSDKIKSVVMPILQPLIDAFDFVSDAVEEVAANLGLIPSAAERAALAQKRAAYEAKEAVIKAEIEKQEAVIEAEQKKRQARSDAYDFEIAKLQAAGEETFEVEQEKLAYVLESLKKQKEALIEKQKLELRLQDEFRKTYRKGAEWVAGVTKEQNEETSKQLQELEDEINDTEETITLNQIKEDKRRNDAAKRAWEERQKAEEEARKKREEDEKAHAERMAMIDKEINERLLTNAREARALTREELNAEQDAEQQARLERNAKNFEEVQNQLKQQKLREIQLEKDTRDAKLSVAESTVAGLSSLTQIAIRDSQKAEKIQKAFALAQIAIDTAKAISALVAASQANPLNAVTVGGAGAAQFASGIATILANMAQAAALLKKPSPNVSALTSGGGGASAGVPINAVDNGSTLIQQPNNNREVGKVVVVESDITSTQQTIGSIEAQATVVE